ncbi:hypothetical protein CI593_13095 [Fischerella thermalis CCMEE 5194]|nr:hypothetical protein CI593_13095 [Fischerella thermalis CCMEE 5194]
MAIVFRVKRSHRTLISLLEGKIIQFWILQNSNPPQQLQSVLKSFVRRLPESKLLTKSKIQNGLR